MSTTIEVAMTRAEAEKLVDALIEEVRDFDEQVSGEPLRPQVEVHRATLIAALASPAAPEETTGRLEKLAEWCADEAARFGTGARGEARTNKLRMEGMSMGLNYASRHISDLLATPPAPRPAEEAPRCACGKPAVAALLCADCIRLAREEFPTLLGQRIVDRPPAEEARCTGLTATWCPNHGDCKCERDGAGERTLCDERCPMHSTESSHAQGEVRRWHRLLTAQAAPRPLRWGRLR
jgi:hypothetical protein